MKRREFFGSSIGMVAASALPALAALPPQEAATKFPNVPGLTKYVSEFIVNTTYKDIPEEVLALGRKSILDGFGLALAGSVSPMGPLIRQYVGNSPIPAQKPALSEPE